MNRRLLGRSGPFLVELIIAISFFTLSCGVCLQLFAKSHTISEASQAYDLAVGETTSITERLRGGEDVAERYYYNERLALCEEEDHLYYIQVIELKDGELPSHQISFYYKDQVTPLYQLEVASYQQKTGGF